MKVKGGTCDRPNDYSKNVILALGGSEQQQNLLELKGAFEQPLTGKHLCCA